MDDRFTTTPDGLGRQPPHRSFTAAEAQVWKALNDEAVVGHVERYYRRGGNYAGATFIDLDPVDPYSFTAADLLSLNLLSVAAQPVAVRRLLEPSRERGHLVRLLSEENLPLDADLAMADTGQLLSMAQLHEAAEACPVARRRQEPEPVGHCLQALRPQAS